MKASPVILDGLAEVLAAELTAISQYFVHHAMAESWGYNVLAKSIKQESMDEMKHAEMLTERILYYDGVPNLQRLGKITVGPTVPEMIKCDYELECDAVARLNRLIGAFQKEGDHGAAGLLMGILADEEHHIDWLENQMHLMQSLGMQCYLSRQYDPAGAAD
ncbi:MAG: bacterioferritin [Planctomycetota bacterium]